jgi:ABC-2 type transport system permease protein
MVFLALVRKQLRDARGSLSLCMAAYLGLSILTVYAASYFERRFASLSSNEAREAYMRFRVLGGKAMDDSTLALEIAMWKHPFMVLPIIGWAMARGSAAVSGEIERGTLDLTLSRPVSRTSYLASQITASLLGIVLIVAALVLGNVIGNHVFTVKERPPLLGVLRAAVMMTALATSVFGYTLPLSAIDFVRWRPGMLSLAATLLGFVGMSLAPMFQGYDWLDRFTVLREYAPVTVALHGSPLAENVGVLGLVFAIGVTLAYLAFAYRDLPTSG